MNRTTEPDKPAFYDDAMEKVAVFECLMCHSWNELRIGDLPPWVPADQREIAFACAEDNRIPLVCMGEDCNAVGLPPIFRRWEYRPVGERRGTKQLTDENNAKR